jgi:hypothetical protein
MFASQMNGLCASSAVFTYPVRISTRHTYVIQSGLDRIQSGLDRYAATRAWRSPMPDLNGSKG